MADVEKVRCRVASGAADPPRTMIGNAHCLPIVDTKNERDPSRAILGGDKP